MPAPEGGRRSTLAALELTPIPTTSNDRAQVRSSATRLEIEVRERESGRALPGARVEVGLTPSGGEAVRLAVLESDLHGRAILDAEPGGARIVAWSRGLTGGPLEVDLAPGRTLRVAVDCLPAFGVTGRVVEADSGLPIAGAEVAFWTFAESDRVVTAADGSFVHPRFPASGRGEQVRVRASGHGAAVRYLQIEPGAWTLLAARPGERSRGGSGEPWIEIELPRELRLLGSVRDSAGRTLPGARISAEGFFRALPKVASRDGAETFSLADGSFELAGLRADIGHSLRVEAPGFAARTLELAPGEGPLAFGPIELTRESLLSGTVVDLEGFPVEDLALQLEPLEPSPGSDVELPLQEGLDLGLRVESTEIVARTSAEGVFVFERLLERPYRLTAARDGAPLVEREVFPLGTGGFAHLELELSRESRALVGRVLLPEGVREATIELSRSGHVGRFTLAHDGSFRASGLDDVAPYRYRVRAVGPHTGERLQAQGTAWVFERPSLDLEPLEEGPELAGLAAFEDG